MAIAGTPFGRAATAAFSVAVGTAEVVAAAVVSTVVSVTVAEGTALMVVATVEESPTERMMVMVRVCVVVLVEVTVSSARTSCDPIKKKRAAKRLIKKRMMMDCLQNLRGYDRGVYWMETGD